MLSIAYTFNLMHTTQYINKDFLIMNIALLAQTAQSGCTLNGQPVDCAVLVEKAKPLIGIGVGLLIFLLVVGIVSFVFWLIMLIHALRHDSPDKNTWIIILVISFFTGFSLIAAFVYLFAEKKKAEQATLAKNVPENPTPPSPDQQPIAPTNQTPSSPN